MPNLTGKIALVTGAARGIGRGIVEALAAAGATVVINDYGRIEQAQEVADGILARGGKATVWEANVVDRDAVERMIAGVVKDWGHLDIVVANAAVSIREPVIEAKWENVLRTIEVTQFGVFHTCQFAAQQMVKQVTRENHPGGKIIVISSVHEEMGFANAAAYNMAKAAVSHLARTMAIELAQYQINVNIINPGWTNTPGERAFYSEEEIERAGTSIPWGRIGRVEDIGKAAAFLASDDAEYVTGTTLRVDGGYMIGLHLPPPTQD
jgi:glucose 1-dehydrogenase